jgi:hypothetical protein
MVNIAEEGIDINLVTYREPDHIYRTDACPYQLGGFSVRTGRAWRWAIPPEILAIYDLSINYLEFLAAYAAVALGVLEGEIQPGDCVLSLTDNQSAERWLARTNFSDKPETRHHLHLARELADLQLTHKFREYPQWIQGYSNQVADILSRHQSLSDALLTQHIRSHWRSQVTDRFTISSLPEILISKLCALARLAPVRTELRRRPLPLRNAPGSGGSNSSVNAASLTTPTSTRWISRADIESSAHLPMPYVRAISRDPFRDGLRWVQRHAAPPLNMLERRFAPVADPTPDSTQIIM